MSDFVRGSTESHGRHSVGGHCGDDGRSGGDRSGAVANRFENRALARETLSESEKGLLIEFWGRVFFLIAGRLSQVRRDGPYET